jgi:hypothetical protein
MCAIGIRRRTMLQRTLSANGTQRRFAADTQIRRRLEVQRTCPPLLWRIGPTRMTRCGPRVCLLTAAYGTMCECRLVSVRFVALTFTAGWPGLACPQARVRPRDGAWLTPSVRARSARECASASRWSAGRLLVRWQTSGPLADFWSAGRLNAFRQAAVFVPFARNCSH